MLMYEQVTSSFCPKKELTKAEICGDHRGNNNSKQTFSHERSTRDSTILLYIVDNNYIERGQTDATPKPIYETNKAN